MAKILQLRRGTTAENDLFTGAVAEVTYDTDRKEIRVHDGSTAGGKIIGAPVASVIEFAGSTAPNGWLVCDGSAISRTTYADLFAVIGTTYGSGNGSTTFNIPNYTNAKLLTNTSASVAIKGTGKSLGFYNNMGLANFSSSGLGMRTSAFDKNNGTSISDSTPGGSTKIAIGVTTDPSKSGLTGTATLSASSIKLCIKY